MYVLYVATIDVCWCVGTLSADDCTTAVQSYTLSLTNLIFLNLHQTLRREVVSEGVCHLWGTGDLDGKEEAQ